jgi:lipopolysaccharide/colanic/teichoic acid biosynthesis glycosyltransferase
MYKFRSMFSDADARLEHLLAENEATGPLFKIQNDPRVTPVGRWLRKFSIDEFPQLINVMLGEMSLVGPRPPLPHEVERYSTEDWRRLEVVPGMTGLWQVSGRSSLTFDEMVRLDLFYIENWSVALDITLMFRTIPAVIFARGAY